MPTVVLKALLRQLAGAGEHEIAGASVGEVLATLEDERPALRGFVRDEQGALRRHLAVFVNGSLADGATAVAADDRVTVLPAISGGADPIELLVGTKKGLIVLRGERDGELAIAGRAFAGRPVEYAIRDRRSGRYLAACNDEHHGPRVWIAEDPTGEWEPSAGPRFPEDADAAVERVWVITEGEAEDELWAGVAPAALFHSADRGTTWELVRGLWEQPSRPSWPPGAGGQMVHTICPWPGDPDRLVVGISAGGIWRTSDKGATWEPGNAGLVARYMPPDVVPTHEFCIHHAERSPSAPDTIYLQFHGGVYRSDDDGRSWQPIMDGLPADFGFVTVADPRDGDRAWVIPLIADMDRVPPDGRLRVYETADRGASWSARTAGLPQKDAHQVVLRQAFCHDGRDPLGLWFGATSGEVYGSADAGHSWRLAASHLPPVLSVRPGV